MKNNRHSGFTLIEVMLASSIMVVIGAGIIGLQFILTQNQLTAFNSYTAVEESNAVLSSITRELRAARESESGAYPLNTLNDNEIIFYSDIDYDGETERVRYFRTGNQLIKGVVEPVGFPPIYDDTTEQVRTLSENILNDTLPTFYYFNSDWPTDVDNNPLLSGSRIADTRLVRIHLAIDIPNDISPERFELEDYVTIRSIKDNL